MRKTVLVVAAHPDDEALGCGGAIARHAVNGDVVHLIFLTDGVGARTADTSESAESRQAASRKAAEIMGATSITQFDFPDNAADQVPLLSIVQKIEVAAASLKPDVVYTHHGGDLNIDHMICNRAALTAFRPTPGQTVREIYGFEVASATNWLPGTEVFSPQRFVDISDQWAVKRAALSAYGNEMRTPPHARSIEALEALARWRGASVGVAAAEAFTVLRQVV